MYNLFISFYSIFQILYDMKLVIVDSLKAWTVTIGCTIINSIVVGFLKIHSLIIIEYQDLLGAPMSLLMLSASILQSLIGLTAPLSTYLSERFTTWKIGILASILSTIAVLIMAFAYNIYILLMGTFIMGLAFSLIYVPTFSIPGKCHIKHQSLSQSVVIAGGSFGTMLIPLGMSLLINIYSIRGVMVILAGYIFHFTIGSVLMPTHIIEIKDDYKPVLVSIQDNKKRTNGSMIKISKWNVLYQDSSASSKFTWPPRRLWRTLVLFSIGMANVMNGYMLLSSLYGAFARSLDISMQDAAFFLMIHSIVDCISRLITGYISDLKLIARWKLYCINTMILCFVAILVGIFPSMYMFYIYLFSNAVFGAFLMVLNILILIDAVGIEYIALSFTIYLLVQGVMAIFSFCAMGYFCDVTGMYNYAMLISGIKVCFGGSLILIDRVIESS